MDVTPLVRKGQQIIQVYAGGVFKVSGVSYPHPIFVTPDETYSWDLGSNVAQVKSLGLDQYNILSEHSHSIDVFLLGTGKIIEFLNPEIKKSLKVRHIHIEVMDTGAACRTYNVLMAEGRRVGALLLPV